MGHVHREAEEAAAVSAPAPPAVRALEAVEAERPLGPPAPEFAVAAGTLAPHQTLAERLAEQDVPAAVVDRIARELRPVFDFRYSRPGDRFRLIRRADGSIAEFAYTTSDDKIYRLFRRDGAFVAEAQEPPTLRRTARIAGVVTTSLYDAIRELGESAQLAADFTQIFAWDVDFSRTVRSGDEFRILYERLYRDVPGEEPEYVRPGRILAASYRGAAGEHEAVYFQLEEGRDGYYRPDGSSVQRQFLAAPVNYSRITSRYSNGRWHPILKVRRPHRGIDYAAPTGTPVWAVASGTVIYKGWGGGLGRLVKVRHSNGHVSYYGHLSRYGSIRVGSRVHQKQVIGYVGSSGLATGPHVHFQIEADGRLVNPASLRTPAGPPVPESRVADFEAVRDERLALLDPPRFVGVEEAL